MKPVACTLRKYFHAEFTKTHTHESCREECAGPTFCSEHTVELGTSFSHTRKITSLQSQTEREELRELQQTLFNEALNHSTFIKLIIIL